MSQVLYTFGLEALMVHESVEDILYSVHFEADTFAVISIL